MRLSEKQVNALVWAALLLLLPLAWLQFRWISEVSDGERRRRGDELRVALDRIAEEADQDAGRLHSTLVGPPGGDDYPLEERIANYHPGADAVPLAGVYRIERQTLDHRWRAEVWNPETEKMEAAPVPEWWRSLPFRNGPIMGKPPGLLGQAYGEESGAVGFVVLLLDAQKVRDVYLPRLLRRHLGERYLDEYALELGPPREANEADGGVGLFRRVARGPEPPGPPPARRGRGGRKKGPGFRRPALLEQGSEGIWRLEARHKGGSLETLIERTRVRNLVVSGVTLLFLGGALGALGYALQRSQRLARLQLEFTAGVSHELRTPLAVIVSAGDNLAEGFVRDPLKVREYGALVRDEGTRLTGMVDQVLRFSEFEADRIPLTRRSVLLSDVIAQVEREMRPAAERLGCEWESSIENAAVSVDAEALRVAVRNLVENALRHGGGKWIRVRGAVQGDTAVVTVEDRGSGISPADLSHLFEPFYRGVDSRAQQRKGSGLGLALVDRIARAHGGSVTAANKPEGGARFTLTIPCR